jgi:carbonic anhydrase
MSWKIGDKTIMGNVLDEVLVANTAYAANFGEKANLPAIPTRHFAIVTCMDSRIDPAKLAGLAEGDAHVIRNAGARASDDALRSLIISYKLLGTREWFIIPHTHCGMAYFTDEIMQELLAESLSPAVRDQDGNWKNTGAGPGSAYGKNINWLTIKDTTQTLISDMEYIRKHPLVPADINIYGYIFDVKTGQLNEVAVPGINASVKS